ncbi:AAA family ATPase [Numidum massiliense]|uniref:AAA family ATPase n=1 Tax=Numidum massiliense TaxID=1522315 RepID=UPI0006D58123|nr:AAA family ATPase [Numidum massiliense]
MVKEIAIGVTVALLAFCAFLGVNVIPIVLVGLLATAFYVLLSLKGTSLPIGKNRRLNVKETVPKTSFNDVGGHKRTKQELMEALNFLIEREKIEAYGIRPIKGLLLSGPPGTGKTLMAKAAAHYTNSVFVAASGSEFVEMYVGVGAQRIRNVFKQARELAQKNDKKSAIVFIDEIDVIGGKRDGAQNREYDQTLNQLLTEMDGIQSSHDVQILVIAATNRPDMLDAALLRPGRFDRHILVDLPDKKAREHILKLYLGNKPLANDVQIAQVAEETFGFSGAQLESLANEAAIYALREQSEAIRPTHLASAIDKVMMGEKTDREATKQERERVAVHELGHALVSELVRPQSVSQVALSPRGKALGYVRQNPAGDKYLYTKKDIENEIKVTLAGAVAEEMIYGNRSTGSRNDFEQANERTVLLIETGLSNLGIINKELANKDAMQEESSRILERLLRETRTLLEQHRELFSSALAILLREEVLSGDYFRQKVSPERDCHCG